MPEEREDEQENGAQPRAIWSGTISFGLLSLPVDLFPANRSSSSRLRMVDDEGRPLARRYYCPEHDQPVDGEEIVRGYEIERDKYVILTDEELESAAPEKSREIDLRRFVDAAQIDPMYFRRGYFLTPSSEAFRAYRLLARTMEEAERAGIATFVMRGKEYLVALLAEDGILRAETLRFKDELRTPSDVGLPPLEKGDPSRQRRYSEAIRALSTPEVEREALSDDYGERLQALAERKLARGEDVIQAGDVAQEQEPGGEVIDLMEVLKQRLNPQGAPPRRAGESERGNLDALTKEELYERARSLNIRGRSKMGRAALIRAIETESR